MKDTVENQSASGRSTARRTGEVSPESHLARRVRDRTRVQALWAVVAANLAFFSGLSFNLPALQWVSLPLYLLALSLGAYSIRLAFRAQKIDDREASHE
ncbi:hypothetical protein [Cryobacterium zhongshanensis]|uniref:Uncharacterized protein n=1 Tax=Cryobacterium zhongshanensis TaxID=2928153 RepID=A0AA41QZI8_9MICO|nr:hypothetical protein [Cryobacterium zhongshanensis]MCI4659748.1 hypothetical protein [Cryobacterium zhongshanensis]